ncbi:sex peptide receptor-like [Saccostrea echinata]|uniref:sex peptide receptor-like n=1 Tax=Saccostrea echinata TaxID=191078 RepID=UPI002A8366C1|nr:sex peptide receptor-like [Saccostrea echinata]
MANYLSHNSTFVGLNNSENTPDFNHSESIYDGDNYDYYSEFYAYTYEITGKWEIPLRGYVKCILAFITIVTNTLLVSVFIFRSTRSPTTIVLTSLAISDSVICFTELPEAIYFNIAENYKNLYVTYQWCKVNHVLYIIYQICRMTSNWFTAVLGIQRLLAVALPFKYSKLCSNTATFVEIAVITLVAFLLNLYEAFGIYIEEIPIYTSFYLNESLPSGCIKEISLGLINTVGDATKSSMIFYIFSGLLYRVLPVAILIFTTVTLAYFLFKRVNNVKCCYSKKKKVTQRTTVLIFLILAVFVVAEIQDGIAYFIYAAELARNAKRSFLSKEADIAWDTISTLLSLMSYACNFWIFFLMSRQFRSALQNIFKSRVLGAQVYFNLEASKKESTCSGHAPNISNSVTSTLV